MDETRLFGTDGVRGTANVHPMTAEMALRTAAQIREVLCPMTRSRRLERIVALRLYVVFSTPQGIDIVQGYGNIISVPIPYTEDDAFLVRVAAVTL